MLSEGTPEEAEEFIHVGKGVSLGTVERLGKEELGWLWKQWV